MEIPAPLMSGTITYFVLTLLACFAGIGMGVTGKLDKENASYVTVSYVFACLLVPSIIPPCCACVYTNAPVVIFCGLIFACAEYLRSCRS